MSNKEQVLQLLLAQKVLPLFFHPGFQESLEVARALYAAGIRVIEFTNRGAEAAAVFAFLKKNTEQELSGLKLGAGTIRNSSEAETFINAGADFIVSPVMDAAIGGCAHSRDLLWIPGCLTPTEVNSAVQHEAALIKIFPANLFGPSYIRTLKEIFQGQLFMPTGGVELSKENIKGWFSSGVEVIGIGSKLISKERVEQKEYSLITINTMKVLQMARDSC